MTNKILSNILIVCLCFLALAHPATTLAAVISPEGACGKDHIDTALGCISTNLNSAAGDSLIKSVINIAIGLGSGFGLVLILYGVFLITTSEGIPEKVKEGSGLITSAVMGLIFIILSVFLLYLIGYQLLGLPSF